MGKVAKEAPRNKPSDHLKYEGEGPWWTADPKGKHKLQSAETGYGSYSKVPLKTIPEIFAEAVKKHGGKPALKTENAKPIKKGEKPTEPAKPLKEWATWTWENYHQEVRKFAKACIVSGMAPFESVNIFGFNTPEWAIAMYGAVFAGGKAAGIYPSDTEDSVQYKSDHSNGAIAVVETAAHLEIYKKVAKDIPTLKAIVCWACQPGDDIELDGGRVVKTYNYPEFLKLGAAEEDKDLEERLSNIEAAHCCALVYTSGTTGRPKAVMLCHDSLNFTAETVFSQVLKPVKKMTPERVISYLPLSHVAGMMLDLVGPLVITATDNYNGYMTVHFARSYDLKTGTLVDRLKTIKPTLFLGVPRVYEKIMEKLLAVGATTKGFKKSLATFAKKRGALYTSTRQLGGEGKTPKTMGIANLLLKQIKSKLGLDKCKFMLSGAAPLPVDVLNYFGSLGININEAYGMSETTGVVTFANDDYHVWGSVGYEVPGTEVRVFQKDGTEAKESKDMFNATEEEQGELCFRGRQIMMGYMANDRLGEEHVQTIEEKNKDAIDDKGFMHSGDKGTKDVRGMIKITGRYKELIIGAGGENIAPVPIEDEMKRLCPFIANAVMIGNKRKFNVMLVTLKTVGATGELPGSLKLDGAAKSLDPKAKTIPQAFESQVFIDAITKAIKETNGNVQVVPSNAAKVQKFTILPRDFSVVTGELTATLKLKRSIVEDQFDPIISKMYEVEDVYVNYNTAPTEGLDMGPMDEEPVLEKNLSKNFDQMEKAAVAEAEKEIAEEEKKE